MPARARPCPRVRPAPRQAQLSGTTADRPGSLALLAQAAAVGGVGIYGLLALPGWSAPAAIEGAGRIVAAAALGALTTTPLALAASIGRGYLAAVGVLFAIIFTAQVSAALGHGAVFPWSVPGLYAGIAGPGREPPGLIGYLLVAATGATGAVTTALWWNHADHTR